MINLLASLAPLAALFALILFVCWVGEKMGWSERTDELIIAGVCIAGIIACIIFA